MRRVHRAIVVAVATAGLSLPSLGHAAMVGIDTLAQWNLVVFDNLNSSGSVQGRSFVGGDLSGGAFYGADGKDGGAKDGGVKDGHSGIPGQVREGHDKGEIGNAGDGKGGGSEKPGQSALVVAGNVRGETVSIGAGGGAAIGGDLNAVLTLSGDGQTIDVAGAAVEQDFGKNVLNEKLGKDFTATLIEEREVLMSSLTSLSDNLSKLVDTAKLDALKDGLVIKAVEGLNVFSLTLADLSKLSDISITAPDGSTTVINVSGASGQVNALFAEGGSDLGRNVIWNFYEARDLAFNSAMFGTVLASGAQVQVADIIGGTLVAQSLTNSGQIQSSNFQGTVQNAVVGVGEVVSAAPEPAGWAMLIGGFFAIGMTMRRARSLQSRVAIAGA